MGAATTFEMVETLSLKNAFLFRIAQKIKKRSKKFRFRPPIPLSELLLNQLNVMRAG